MGAGCQSTAPLDFTTLASADPAPYSVVVTGGVFVEGDPAEAPLDRTFAVTNSSGEVVSIEAIADALRTARTFVRIEHDHRDVEQRRAFAGLTGPLSVADPSVRELLDEAAANGHDYLLFVQRLADGPVTEYGINSRWPITGLAWLIIGLGMLIPDHTYESRAKLHVVMRDAHSGQVVYSRVLDGDPVDLALVERGDIWGILISIIIPPFWVGSDDQNVVDEVRYSTGRRLMFLLAEDLKGAGCRNELLAKAPAKIEVEHADGGVRVNVTAEEGLSFVRASVDSRALVHPDYELFTRELLGSAVYGEDEITYEAVCRAPIHGRFLHVLVQTVGGRVASTTVDLDRPAEVR